MCTETKMWRVTDFDFGRYKNRALDIVVYIFVFLFIYTAASKLLTHQSFREVLSMSPLIGNYSAPLAWLVPLTEIVISVLLFFKQTLKLGLFAALILMIIFTVYLVYMVFSGSTLPCHCGGVIKAMTWQQHIVFNLVFVVLAGLGLKWKLNLESRL